MKLTDLDPRWLVLDGRRVGFAFLSPFGPERNKPRSDGTPNPTHWRQSCFAEALPRQVQWQLFDEVFGEAGTIQGCKPEFAWTIEGGIENATFETMTVSPSLDGSAGGLWHGHITGGEIVGGI